MSKPLEADISEIKAMMAKALIYGEELVQQAWKVSETLPKKISESLTTNLMCLVAEDGAISHYDGNIKVIDPTGKTLHSFQPEDYKEFIDEEIERDTWSKFPYLRKLGFHDGVYRVGPLARCNVAEELETPKASQYLKKLKKLTDGEPLQSIFYYHVCRCIELINHIENIIIALDDKNITSKDTRITVNRKAGEGVGVVEAPRGTLIHHYSCKDNGEVTSANMIVPTTHNNRALSSTVNEVANKVVSKGKITESGKQKIEMAVRSYDPCLSCATHAWDKKSGINIELIPANDRNHNGH